MKGNAPGAATDAAPAPAPCAWSLVVPVKPAAVGKSRLAVPGVDRAAAARAIALDTLEAASAAGLVAELVVVTDDPGVRAALEAGPESDRPAGSDAASRAGHSANYRTARPTDAGGRAGQQAPPVPGRQRIRFVADPGAGLNAAIAAGLAAATTPLRAVMLGDLPSLRPADLDDALARAAHVSAGDAPLTVADADGTGTTLLAHARADVLRFGGDSYSRHLAAGALALDVPAGSTLRQDLDTAAHLDAARALGLGPRTARLLG